MNTAPAPSMTTKTNAPTQTAATNLPGTCVPAMIAGIARIGMATTAALMSNDCMARADPA